MVIIIPFYFVLDGWRNDDDISYSTKDNTGKINKLDFEHVEFNVMKGLPTRVEQKLRV